MYKIYITCQTFELATYTYLMQQNSCNLNEKFYLLIEKLIKKILLNLNTIEKIATNQKLMAFARQKFSLVFY